MRRILAVVPRLSARSAIEKTEAEESRFLSVWRGTVPKTARPRPLSGNRADAKNHSLTNAYTWCINVTHFRFNAKRLRDGAENRINTARVGFGTRYAERENLVLPRRYRYRALKNKPLHVALILAHATPAHVDPRGRWCIIMLQNDLRVWGGFMNRDCAFPLEYAPAEAIGSSETYACLC